MTKIDFDTALSPVLEQDPRYARAAYQFVREALEHTQVRLLPQGETRPRHVSASQLLEGIREFALDEFGPMACLVFEEWGIHSCDDFGDIVFNMMEHGILAKGEHDQRADFKSGFNFKEAFRRPFAPERHSSTTAQS